MQSSSGSQTTGLCTIMRVALVGCTAVIAVVLLLWIRVEQSHVEQCTNLIRGDDQRKEPPPVHVVVHLTAPNQTNDSTTVTPPTDGRWNYNWDHKQWSVSGEAGSVAVRTVLLIRHGQYDLQTGLLTESGRHQANLTGSRLRELNFNYDRIVHSNLERAEQTAKLIHAHLPHLPLAVDPMLAEGGPAPPEPTVNYWSLPERNYFVEGPRLEAAFRKYFYRADNTQAKESIDVLVGHGNIFRYFILRALQFPRTAWMRVFIPHASISELHMHPDGTVTLTRFGDSGHMPPSYVTI